MASQGENIKSINKDNAGFPAYLDFEKLRAEGIAYLGKLSGKIWTDHNVHDPGITILEVLCYSLLDLGYRTNLPAIDLFSRDPKESGADNNFFTAAQILSCNPLTIMDYRKFLIDIEGVKNAWLEVATDQTDFCRPRYDQQSTNNQNSGCVEYLNGLYHIFIEPEKDVNKDFPDESAANTYLEELNKTIKSRLMAHRNFCEDFVDISMLCKIDVGVCAVIELQNDADLEKSYQEIVQRLRDFISPVPKFYTLQELLDREKAIEDIFAGRPYNPVESHGFIDTDELYALKLKKEIHISDLYQVILESEGVKSVNKLAIRNCESGRFTDINEWKFKIPENLITNFSVACSGIQFTKNGIPIEFDSKKFQGLFNLNFSNSGKVLYQLPSPYLDNAIPSGTYHENLDEYFLLQDDFPRVYGIAEGGLPDDVSNQRKAQALQLKGYLLFFDQLLSGYLAQLKNIRSLFSMNSPDDSQQRRTYFLNQLTDKPELSKLLRFAVGTDQNEILGAEGDSLIRVIKKSQLDQLISNNSKDISALEQFQFSSLIKQQIAINQLIEDFSNNNFEYGFIYDPEGKIFYYLNGTSAEFALISKISFPSLSAANLHLSSVAYVGSFEENYRSYIIDENHVSFDIELNIASFKSYLALILEDEDLYAERRNSFLNHLLSRFAERFTDDVLMQFNQQSNLLIHAKEDLLSHYDEISANRGRAYDYLKDEWNNNNISGFETEAKYLAGISNKQLNSLCNFVVEQLDEYYLVELNIAEDPYFKLTEKFDSPKEAEEAAQMAFDSLAQPERLKTRYVPHEKMYSIVLQYDDRSSVPFYKQYATSQEADEVRAKLNRMFSKQPVEDVYISSYAHKVQLVDHKGNILRNSVEAYDSDLSAIEAGRKNMSKLNDSTLWQEEDSKDNKINLLTFNDLEADDPNYIDVKAFKITINNSIVGKPDKFTYDLLDHANSFKFYAAKEFSSNKEAKANAYLVLKLAGNSKNYSIVRTSIDSKWQLKIVYQEQVEAICYTEFDTEEEAIKLRNQIITSFQHASYRLTSNSFPKGWKFNYELGYDQDSNFKFSSSKEYRYKEEAIKASHAFQQAIPSLRLGKGKNGIILTQQNRGSKLPTVNLDAVDFNEESINKALDSQKSISQFASSNKAQNFRTSIRKESTEDSARYIYRLVDKDHVLAYYQDQFLSKEEAVLAKMKISRLLKRNLNYLQLCLGTAVIKEVSGNKNKKAKSYSYQIRAHNIQYKHAGPINEELVIFESFESFPTKEQALEAFENNLFNILELAAIEQNYGSLISFEETKSENSAAVVFVPLATQEEIKAFDEGSIPQMLMQLLRTYPIKRNNDLYYFETFHSSKDTRGWHSVKEYPTADAAMQDFLFFLMLLKYTGNLYVDCDFNDDGKGNYRIYIREVLAESSQRFYTEEEAWGLEGVEKLICAIQSDLGFQKYQRKEDCCYSFYINCGADFLIHPCTYDTAKKRNQVVLDLYDHFKRYEDRKAYTLSTENNSLIFHDEGGKPFAIRRFNENENQEFCDLLFDYLDELQEEGNSYVIEKEFVFVKNNSGQVILESYSQGWTEESFKEQLELFLCFFPIIRSKNEKSEGYQYHIEIKLPGFNTCKEENTAGCGCSDPIEEEPTCFVAWKTSCPIQNCYTVMRLYGLTTYLLSNFENYQSILDCSCNSFGIALDFNLPEYREQFFINGKQIAFNPQCYETSQEMCKAVDRANELINAEGLQVVEHILLRPRCEEDCEVRQGLYCNETYQYCGYTWKADQEDPCSDQSDICFVPAIDPYSFIATVALPAWPKRFRSETGRMLMEDILYRLAPAHVMLRILWLAPHDYCCFESKYKNWRQWLAKRKTCNTDFTVDDFLNFLFHRNYEELVDCETCKPCADQVVINNPCTYRDLNQDGNYMMKQSFLDQVNASFCWRVSYPGEYQFISCDRDNQPNYDYVRKIQKEEKEEELKPIAPVASAVRRGNSKELKLLKERRMMHYRSTIEQIAEKLKKNLVIQSVQNYMSEPNLAINQLEAIVTQIIENKKTTAKNYVVLNRPQMQRVLESVVCYALDQVNHKKKNKTDLTLINAAFEKMRKAKIDVDSIYNHWDGTELKKHQPVINVVEIKNLILGTKK